jgi:hypothetical protein
MQENLRIFSLTPVICIYVPFPVESAILVCTKFCLVFVFCFVFLREFWKYWDSTSGFALSKQVLYHLSHASKAVSHFLPWRTCNPHTYVSCVARITGMSHYTWYDTNF